MLLVVVILFCLFSVSSMAYISMASMIGPWIDTTLALLSIIIFNLLSFIFKKKFSKNFIFYPVIAASLGGILATAIGFSFPAIKFSENIYFRDLLSDPYKMILIIIFLSLSAGFFGLWMSFKLRNSFINMPFVVGQLLSSVVTESLTQTKKLFSGSLVALIYSYIINLINLKQIKLYKHITLNLDHFLIYISIGFLSGKLVLAPFITGILVNYCLLLPIYEIYIKYFSFINFQNFTLAFCTGLIVYGAFAGILSTIIKSNFKEIKLNFKTQNNFLKNINFDLINNLELILFAIFAIPLFLYFKFSFINFIYIITGTAICVYQCLFIAGKFGIAPLGRFATFLMVPAMFIFNLNKVQLILISTFVEIAVGVASDSMFLNKFCQISDINFKKNKLYQTIGIVICSICAGFIFFLIFKHIGISPEGSLDATRAHTRSLFLDFAQFDWKIILLGAIFAYILTFTKISPMLLLGGILMPITISLFLIIGALMSLYFEKPEKEYPFFSGMFSTNSIIVMFREIFLNI